MPANMGEFQTHRMKPKRASGGGSTLGKIRAVLKARSEIKNIMKTKLSWKTTLGGILMALGQAVPAILPDAWDWLGGALTGLGGVILGGAARDNNVTSEEAGAK